MLSVITIHLFSLRLQTVYWLYSLRFCPNYNINVFLFRCAGKVSKKTSISFATCLSVRTEKHGSHWTDFHEISYLTIFFLPKNLLIKLKFVAGIIDTLRTSLWTFTVISRWILLRMRNILEQSCRENQNTRVMLNECFSKIVPFLT